MLAGTDGSIFLITYQPDPVDVITVDGVDEHNRELVQAIQNADKDAVAAASAASVPVLASVEFAAGMTPSASELKTKLDGRQSEISQNHGNTAVTSSAVVWMYQGLSDGRKTQSQDHADSVLTALGVTDVPAVPRHEVDFAVGSGAPVRIYVLIAPEPGQ
jgi:hypothetical protein